MVLGGVLLAAQRGRPADPLPSWNDGSSKKAITDFVAKVTKEGGPDFVPVNTQDQWAVACSTV